MFARKRIKDPGTTDYTRGDIVEVSEVMNSDVKADSVIMGISEVSLSRSSFLSAASFQHTPRVLIQAAIRGAEDELLGLKENVIIGRLIPAGTGFPGGYKQKLIWEEMSKQSKNV